jgi:hypothetical protein
VKDLKTVGKKMTRNGPTAAIFKFSFIFEQSINGTLLNFGKRYEDNSRVIFDQWPKLHLGSDALSNQKILNGI